MSGRRAPAVCATCAIPIGPGESARYAYVVIGGRLVRKRICGSCCRRSARILGVNIQSAATTVATAIEQSWQDTGRPVRVSYDEPAEALVVFCACCDHRMPEPATDAEAIAEGWALLQFTTAGGELARAWRCSAHWRRRGDAGDGAPPDFKGSPTWGRPDA